MANINSGLLNPNEKYILGKYEFQISTQYETSRQATIIIAMCGDIGASVKPAAYKMLKGERNISNWIVDVNDNIADVYCVVDADNFPDIETNIPKPIETAMADVLYGSNYVFGAGMYDFQFEIESTRRFINVSGTIVFFSEDELPIHARWRRRERKSGTQNWSEWSSFQEVNPSYSKSVELYGRIAYSASYQLASNYTLYSTTIKTYVYMPDEKTIWYITYFGSQIYRSEELLVGRFEIDMHDAGGTGPGSDWTDPGDWNENPNTVLNVNIEGALSGRHNDPLHDSYSYLPEDQDSAAGYGCGGDGGHGGGGGAGASTIIVRKFGTDKANSKNIIASPKRHGYGSGGGRGGKGGDGCILIYY